MCSVLVNIVEQALYRYVTIIIIIFKVEWSITVNGTHWTYFKSKYVHALLPAKTKNVDPHQLTDTSTILFPHMYSPEEWYSNFAPPPGQITPPPDLKCFTLTYFKLSQI